MNSSFIPSEMLASVPSAETILSDTASRRARLVSITGAASPKKGAPKGQKVAKPAAPKKVGKQAAKRASAKEASTPRAESKRAKIRALNGRPKGAGLAEIMKATDWQKGGRMLQLSGLSFH